MSGAAEAVVLAPLFDFLDEHATVMVESSALACYRAARHLPDAYKAAMSEFRGRAEAELGGLFVSQQAHDAAMARAAQLVARAQTPVFDANLEFLRASLTSLRARLETGADAPPELAAQFALLENAISETPGELAANWREFERLQNAVSRALLERAAQKTAAATRPDEKKRAQIEHLSAELETVASQLEGPLWKSDEGEKAREKLREKLEIVRALLESQPASAAQALLLLHSALGRARDSLAAQEELRRAQVAEKTALVRELAGSVAARAQALSGQDADPQAREAALQLLSRLSTLLARDFEVSELRALAGEAETLFENTQKSLHETAFAAYLRAQVADVLGELGYRVSQLEGQSLVAVMDDKTGVEIAIDGSGALSSHMVVFSDAETAPANVWAQEKACALLDEVYAGLRRRQLSVREKKRKTLRDGERVKTLPKSVVEREKLAAQSEAKARHIE